MRVTAKAEKVLRKMRRRSLFQTLETRDRVPGEFHRDQMADVGPIGGQERMKVLREMNDLKSGDGDFIRSLVPSVTVQ